MSQSTKNGFQIFQGTTTESADKAQITVRKGGNLVLTRAAVDMLGEGATHVQLAYNDETGAIGIRSAEEDAAGSYTLRTQKSSPSRLVGGKRFFQHHGLEIEKARTFDAEDFGDGLIGFTLGGDDAEDGESDSGSDAGTKTRKKKSASRKTKAAA